jgi:hypothetical protein
VPDAWSLPAHDRLEKSDHGMGLVLVHIAEQVGLHCLYCRCVAVTINHVSSPVASPAYQPWRHAAGPAVAT